YWPSSSAAESLRRACRSGAGERTGQTPRPPAVRHHAGTVHSSRPPLAARGGDHARRQPLGRASVAAVTKTPHHGAGISHELPRDFAGWGVSDGWLRDPLRRHPSHVRESTATSESPPFATGARASVGSPVSRIGQTAVAVRLVSLTEAMAGR